MYLQNKIVEQDYTQSWELSFRSSVNKYRKNMDSAVSKV